MAIYPVIDLGGNCPSIPADTWTTINPEMTKALLHPDPAYFGEWLHNNWDSIPTVPIPKITTAEIQELVNDGKSHMAAACVRACLAEDPSVFANETWYPTRVDQITV